jgi:DNA-binding beta-propeller fold protein YncE
MRWLRPIVLSPLAILLAACTASSGATAGTDRSGGSATTGPTPSVSPGPSRPTRSRGVPAGVHVGPWDARTVGGRAARGVPLAGTRGSLYVSAAKAILRLDPSSGAVLARRTVGSGAPPQAAIAANALWTVESGSPRTLVVRGLSLDTLTPVASITLHVPPGTADDAALDVAPSDGRLYVGAGHTVAVIDAKTHHLVHRFQLRDGPIADLAVTPDDTRLYVTSDVANTMFSRVNVLDPATGATTSAVTNLDGGTGYDGIAASAGGIWLQTGSGMTDWREFRPAADLAQTDRPVTSAGGGWATTATVIHGVVWLGGTTKLVCADPRTGAVRAAARVPAPHNDAANISRITVAGGHLFAYYRADAAPSPRLITLDPPARCDA